MIYLKQKAEEYAASEVPFDTTESGEKLYTKHDLEEAYIAGAKGSVAWHNLKENPDDLPEVGKLVRVRLTTGMERICETDYYKPSEDEIGFGKLILSFYELNDKWVDDNDIVAWCELPRYEVEK